MLDESRLIHRTRQTRWRRNPAQRALVSPAETAARAATGPEPSLDSSIRPELIFVSVVLGLYFAVFYHRWPLWEDHAIYHYMAWGLSHGLVPYRDTINMNWPGSIGIHLLARAISGSDGIGLRLLDCVFLIVLSAATCTLLRAYRVAASVRLLCVTSYLAGYFLTDFRQTGQRESFALPLVAVGLACCLIQARWEKTVARWAAVACGLAAALGLSIKPTLVLPLVLVQALPIVCRPGLKQAYRFVFWFGLGEAAAGLCMLLFLSCVGDGNGFWEWGVRYAFGPYAAVRWPFERRLLHTLDWSVWAPPVILAVAGGTAFVSGLAGGERRGRWRAPVVFGLLAASMLATVLIQGKTHCRYHYHPFFWAVSLAGAIALQRALKPAETFVSTRLSGAFCLALLAMVAVDTTHRQQPALTDGTVLGNALRARLAPTDEFVLFGFAPTLHARINRRTPFPYIDSWVMLSCCGDNDQERLQALFGRALAEAVRKPNVKCVVLQRQQIYAANNKWITIGSIESKYVPDRDLEALGYSCTHLHMKGETFFDIWMRGSAAVTARQTTQTPTKRTDGGVPAAGTAG